MLKFSTIIKPPIHILTFSLLVAGCGSDGGADTGPDATPAECPTDGRYMGLTTGKSWTYRVTDVVDGTVAEKTQTVGALEDVGGAKAGTMAYKMTTVKLGGTVESWQEDTGEAIRRHREIDLAGGTQGEEIYEPHKLRVDESAARIVANAMYTEMYTEHFTDAATMAMTMTMKTEDWTVEELEDQVTVPAGTFCAMRLRRISMTAVGGSDKTYWFARGVGKVKEVGVNRIEELMSFTP